MSLPAYQDDATIRDEERLFRRIHLRLLVRDDDTGLARVSSGAFKDKELSVCIESVLIENGRTSELCLQNYYAHKLMFITAGQARQFNQAVCHDPVPDDPSHGLVYGSKNNPKTYNGLCCAATWVIPNSAPRFDDIEAERRKLGI